MKKKYTSSPLTKIIFIIILMFLTTGPLIAALQYEMSRTEFIIVLGVIYGAYAPLIYFLGRLFKKYMTSSITLTSDGIELNYRNTTESIPWSDVNAVVYDYTLMSTVGFSSMRYSVIYEVQYRDSFFRFNTQMDKDHNDKEDISEIHVLDKKNFTFDSYGLYFRKKKASELLKNIEDLCGHCALREKDLFLKEIT